MSLYDLQPGLYRSIAQAARLMGRRTERLTPAKDYIVEALCIAALVALFIIHTVSDVNTTMMILDWLKSLLG